MRPATVSSASELVDSEYVLQKGIQEPTLRIKLTADLAESIKLR